jgi:type I restriction enzyme S subunit
MFRRVKYTGFPDEQLLSVYRDYGAIPKSSRDDNFNKASEDLSAYQLVRPGNLVMNKMKAWQGSIAISEHRGIVSPAYFVYESWRRDDHRMNAKYIHYLLRSPAYITQYLSQSKGIRVSQWDLDPAAFERIEILLPPLEEQTQIAKFLDYETAKIDALIAKQQQLIALLQEKRQAVISHAVTKGLNPAAPLRDSGVAWLGQVPAHWEVKRLKHLFAEPLRNGASPQPAETGGILTFSIAAVRDGVVDIESHLKYAEISAHAARPYWVHLGDVMMMRGNGSRDLVGSVGIVKSLPPEGCIYPDILIRLRFTNEIDSRLAVLFLNSTASRPQVEMGAKTAAGIWKVSGATVAEFSIPVPPSGEQKAICDHVDLVLTQIDTLMKGIKLQRSLLQERRTALISAAVTGKIDVRGWQPPPATAAGATP